MVLMVAFILGTDKVPVQFRLGDRMKNKEFYSLEGFMWGCEKCGGKPYKRILKKRAKARFKRQWQKDMRY